MRLGHRWETAGRRPQNIADLQSMTEDLLDNYAIRGLAFMTMTQEMSLLQLLGKSRAQLSRRLNRAVRLAPAMCRSKKRELRMM